MLDSYGVKATFFVTNRGYGEMMKEIVDRGHSIGIHTMSHVYERIYASPEAYFADLLEMAGRYLPEYRRKDDPDALPRRAAPTPSAPTATWG